MNKVKRYRLTIPEPLFNELKKAADRRDITIFQLVKQYIFTGLMTDNKHMER